MRPCIARRTLLDDEDDLIIGGGADELLDVLALVLTPALLLALVEAPADTSPSSGLSASCASARDKGAQTRAAANK